MKKMTLTLKAMCVTLLFSLSGIADAGAIDQTNAFASFVRQHRGELWRLARPEDLTPSTSSVDGVKLKRLLDEPEGPEGRDANLCCSLLSRVVAEARRGEGPSDTKPFLRDEVVVSFLIQALFHPQLDVRSSALSYLDQYVATVSEISSNYAKPLIAAWPHNPSWAVARMIAATHTDEGNGFLLRLLAQGIGLPDEVRAKLGVEGNEGVLIARFQAETNAKKKGDLALKLGYVGTTNAVQALVKELRSPLMDEYLGLGGPQYRRSVRFYVVQGLGRAFPESRLLNEELQSVTRGLPPFNRDLLQKRQEEYIENVEKWCQEQFGVQWPTERPTTPFWEYIGMVHLAPR